MATMTTGHSLSVLTNSSVKPPRNPRTGLSTSLHERSDPLSSRFSGIFYDDYDDDRGAEKEILSTKSKFASTTDPYSILQLSNLSDDEFYHKLTELKNEQRKILQKCEKMYIDKHNGVVTPTFVDDDVVEDQVSPSTKGQSHRTKRFVDQDGVLVATTVSRTRSPVLDDADPSSEIDNIRESLEDCLSKPPTGRPPLPVSDKSSYSPIARPSSAPLSRNNAVWSLEDLRHTAIGLRRSFNDSDVEDDIPDDTVSEPYNSRDITKNMSRLEDMWHDFSIEDYAPRREKSERRLSGTFIKKEKKNDDSWRHRLTIPQPFSMTVREQKKDKKKSKNQIDFEEKMLQQQLEEEEELKKQFKARPVPAHVYLPLFDEIKEQQECKRQHIRQSSADLLKSQEKPFSFMKREQDRKKHQLMERDCNQTKTPERPKSATFKAKPVPKAVFDKGVDDRILEEEEYRKIRMKMRAEELLRSATLPPSMGEREKVKLQKEREVRVKSKKKGSKSASYRPRINHDVPDYDALYRQFQTELQQRKGEREGTVSRPFRLEGHRNMTCQEKIRLDMERDEETLKENRWPYKMSQKKPANLGHMTHSLDSIPSKSTRAADARNKQTKGHMQQLTQRELREIEEDRRRRVKEMRLRKTILQSTSSRETPRETPEEKKRKFRDQERARIEVYEREKQEMLDRVNRRPLLFEQQTQTNAKKAAEKKFNATLRSVGLDEDFIQSRGSRSASIHDYTDDYDDDFEETAMKRGDDTYIRGDDSVRSASPMEA